MRDIRTEARKHFGFFSICALILLTAFTLRELVDSHGAVLDAVWVFAVILVSSGAAFYVGAQIFMFLVLQRDTLLHLSTHPPLRKFFVKAGPLSLGFAAVGLVSLLASTTMWPDEWGLTAAVVYAVCAKLVSCTALVSSAWALGLAAARFAGFYPRLLVYAGGLAALIGLQIAALWQLADLGGTKWLVGGSTSFGGYPVYCGPLAISIGTPFSFDPTGPYALGLDLNLLWAVLAALVLLLQSRRHRTRLRAG